MTGRDDSDAVTPARILIVDDEPLNVDYLEQELDCHGFVTDSAVNGLEALERVAASPPDLVLLDVMMPEMDGIAVLRVLKQDPETRLIPVVLMTALNAVDDRVRGIEAGADDFLSKPVDDRELLARIRTALALKRTIDEAVGELRSTSAYLERFGRQQRDVVILAVDWRVTDQTLPEHAAAFVGRGRRAEAEELISDFGGLLSETDDRLFLAVFERGDLRSRSVAGVEAALALVGVDGPDAAVVASVAVDAGQALVGSTRTGQAGALRWVWGAQGDPVERASALAGNAPNGTVMVTTEVAAAVSDRFSLQPEGDNVYAVSASATDDATVTSRAADRRVRTILVTDIVGSTTTVERVGDRVGGELLAANERLTRAELALYGGEEIDTGGDSFLAAFDSPARAIRCAFAVLARVRELGLVIRAGVHTGELERVEGRARGIALHVAARIADRAGPGEVLVSATTRELTAGAGLQFADRGEHTLKGVSEKRHLFAALDQDPTVENPAGSS